MAKANAPRRNGLALAGRDDGGFGEDRDHRVDRCRAVSDREMHTGAASPVDRHGSEGSHGGGEERNPKQVGSGHKTHGGVGGQQGGDVEGTGVVGDDHLRHRRSGLVLAENLEAHAGDPSPDTHPPPGSAWRPR
jgi:hypothetical protein